MADRIGGVPNQPRTPSRNVRVSDELWEAAKQQASERGETVADVIRRALEVYVRSDGDGSEGPSLRSDST